MAAGRHEGHRDGESMDKEPEIDSSRRRDFYFYKGEKDRCRNRDSERESSRYRGLGREKGRDRTRELERETIRVRHRDLREIEANGGYHSSSSTSNSGSSGSHNKFYAKGADREPGELSSGSGSEEGCGYEEPARLQVRDADVQKSENGVSTLGRKRKYSPIVWDRDEMQTGNLVRGKSLVNSRDSVRVSEYSHTTDLVSSPLPPPPPLPQGYRKSPYLSSRDIVPVSGFKGSGSTPNNSSGLQVSPNKPSNAPGSVGSAASESPLASSPTSIKEQSEKNFSRVDHCRNQTIDIRTEAYWANDSEPGQLVESSMHEDEEEYMPTWNILASRWADENNSLVDEVSDGEGIAKGKKNAQRLELEGTRILSEQSVIGKVMSQSPELGEFMAEGFDGARLKSSGSDGEGSRGVNVSIGHDETASKEEDPGNDLGREEDLMEIDVEDVNDEDIDHESETDSEETVKLTPPPQRSINMLQGCRSVDEFEKLNKIDEGTYGVVFRAMDKKTKEIVALKKVKMEKETEGFPMTSLREINILLSFHHPSIVDVKEVVVGNKLDHIFMVMEYMEHDLKGLMETMKQPFSQSEVKCLMLQLFEGVKYLHDNWVLHRDLKTSNLLLNNRGELKICDFGLARQYGSPLKPYTHLVVTLWYRAPELLLGGKQYSTAIDMWSLGCIMAELLAKEPLFPGKSEIDQLEKIYRTLGTPSEKIWPGFINLPGVKVSFVKQPLPAMGDSGQAFWYNKLRDKFPPTSFSGRPTLSEAGFDLLNKLLTYDPEKRITADDALKHEWFREVPLPKSKDFMPTFPASHAQDRRLRRIMKSPDPLEEQRRKELQQGELGTGLTSNGKPSR